MDKRMILSALSSSRKRLRLELGGIVQGVGFRPFVCQLAEKFSLSGFVLNDGSGLEIEVEGDEAAIERFVQELSQTPPPLSRIDFLESTTVACQEERGFLIRPSQQTETKTMLSADIAICDLCSAEMHDPSNRRFDYPFINCTDCGPRYSIIQALPYDREHTSMSAFKMCPSCKSEYSDPLNRRYHAQAISCHDCGPRLSLLNLEGEVTAEDKSALEKACLLIEEGKTVAIKGLGGYHLVCDARSEEAVRALRRNKRRPTKPLAVMFSDMDEIKKVSEIDEVDKRLILSKERPIVIVTKADGTKIAPSVAPGIDRLGVFLPYTPLHVRLLERLGFPVVATSANLSDEPIITDEREILRKLSGVISAVLAYDREIINACDDSVLMRAGEETLLIRMARGFAPKSLPLAYKVDRKIMALGANQKSTISLAFGEHILLSAHIGDLLSLEAFGYFERTLKTFKQFYDFEPDIIVCDRHPEYETTKWAKERLKENPSITLIEVQHHYAHALACMAEYRLDEKVLAFCFDGTGYGDDATLWGGEVLIADPLHYERILHLRPFRLIGGEKALKEPRRIALALLFDIFELDEVVKMDNPAVKSFTAEEIHILHRMWEKGINSPLSSSVGRLFEGIASLIGISQRLGYEGESGLLLERLAQSFDGDEAFAYEIVQKQIDCTLMIKEVLGLRANEAAFRFISMLCKLVVETAQSYPTLPVVLSGGVFQNRLLVEKLTKQLRSKGLRYYIQQETPVNDGGIALGQAYHALHLSRKKMDEK